MSENKFLKWVLLSILLMTNISWSQLVYIGSYQSQINTNDEGFEIGTYNGTGGNLHLTTGSNNPRITVTSDGKVVINNLTPEAYLDNAGDVKQSADSWWKRWL